ncbi:hypothetical protein LCGC14_2047460, partial [marine sediment metagenome]
SRWPKPDKVTQKKWAETQIRIWLRNIVGAHKRGQDRIVAMDAGGYGTVGPKLEEEVTESVIIFDSMELVNMDI